MKSPTMDALAVATRSILLYKQATLDYGECLFNAYHDIRDCLLLYPETLTQAKWQYASRTDWDNTFNCFSVRCMYQGWSVRMRFFAEPSQRLTHNAAQQQRRTHAELRVMISLPFFSKKRKYNEWITTHQWVRTIKSMWPPAVLRQLTAAALKGHYTAQVLLKQ